MTVESLRLCDLEVLPYRSRPSLLPLLLPPPLLSRLLSLRGRGVFDSRLAGRTVWPSHGTGVVVWFDLEDPLADTDRTIVLSFSRKRHRHQLSGIGGRTSVEFLTNI